MVGTLCLTPQKEWVVVYEFGEDQVKILKVNNASVDQLNKDGVDGSKVEFEIVGMSWVRAFNGTIPSAKILFK